MRVPAMKPVWLACALVAALQTAVLGYIIYDKVRLLQTGREVVLPVVPVDPRSLFQGDYVILDYDISRQQIAGAAAAAPAAGATVYVTLAKAADGTWAQTGFAISPPAVVKPDDVVLRGKVQGSWTDGGMTNVSVVYGIEQYFVEEGKGKELEAQVRDRKIAVLLAVDTNGRAAIKGLMADGELRYREPLL